MPSANARKPISCDNTGYAQKAYVYIDNNYINQPVTYNNPCIDITSNNDASLNTLSKVTMNVVNGSSSGVLVRQATHGTIEHIGNTITNAGAGGTTIGVTGSAAATAL
jgi:hypothetical protein